MLNCENYRQVQTDLLNYLKDKKDRKEATERYCQENNLILFQDFIFDDWQNTIVLRIIDDEIEGLHIHLVELPFKMELHRKLKEGKGNNNGR